jgi:hypothetical protein
VQAHSFAEFGSDSRAGDIVKATLAQRATSV